MDQFKRTLGVALIGVATTLTSGCAMLGNHTEVIKDGSISVLAVDGTPHLTHLTPFHVTVYAASLDDRQNEADVLNESLAKAGYEVSMNRDTMLFTTRELFAGPASQYKPEEQYSGSPILSVAKLASSGAACILLGACSNPVVVVNELANDADTQATNSLTKSIADGKQQQMGAALLVVNEICLVDACGASYASSNDPKVTLDQLRLANAAIGMPQVLRARPQ